MEISTEAARAASFAVRAGDEQIIARPLPAGSVIARQLPFRASLSSVRLIWMSPITASQRLPIGA